MANSSDKEYREKIKLKYAKKFQSKLKKMLGNLTKNVKKLNGNHPKE